MLKLNNKGFTLAETLVTVVFVMVIFSTIYMSYTPLMAEYERRETYDDIDGIYTAYWVKKLVESGDFNGGINCPNVREFSCNDFTRYKDLCNRLVGGDSDNVIIENMYLAPYEIGDNSPSIPNMSDYVKYLPNTSDDPNKCRIYIEMKRKTSKEINDHKGTYGSGTESYGADIEDVKEYYAYSNIEVNKQ